MISSNADKSYPPCPDGGWGWIVVFASFMIHVIADGVIYSFGLFYYELAKYFGASKAVTSMVVSIMNGTTYCIGPIASALTIKFGCRAVTISGAICCSAAFFISTLATNIYILYLTIGLLGGFGFGLMYLPAIVIVTSYFEKKRAFATGIAVCGSGIGTAIMSPLIEYLINLYGWKGTMLVISALMLECVVFGFLFKPLQNVSEKKEIGKELKDKNNINDLKCSQPMINLTLENLENVQISRLSLKNEKHQLHQLDLPKSEIEAMTKSSVEVHIDENMPNETKPRSHSFSPGFLYRKDIFYSGSLVNIPHHKSEISYAENKVLKKEKPLIFFQWFNFSEEIQETLSEMIDLSLMKNQVFLIFSISNFLTSIGYYIPYIYLKDWIVENKIEPSKETGSFTAIIGIFSTISRLIFGYLSDQSFVNRFWLYIVSVTLCGLIIMANTLATTSQLLNLFCALFGMTCGTYVSLTSVVLVDLLGLERLTNAFGLILLFQGIASIIGPFFIGFIYDLSGVYDFGFYTIGFLVAFSGIMLIWIDLENHIKSIKRLLKF